MSSKYYYIEGTPAVVRENPSMSSNIINAIQSGAKIEVYKEANGWLYLTNGGYILIGNNIIPEEMYIKRSIRDGTYITEETEVPEYNPITRTIKFAATRDTGVTTSDVVRIRTGARDVDGNSIDPKYMEGGTTIVSVVDVSSDGTIITVRDTVSGVQFRVAVEDVNKLTTDGFTDVSAEATAASNSSTDTITSYLTELYSAADVTNLTDQLAKLERFTVNDTRTVFGMPYQFLPIADTRLDGTDNLPSFGRKYYQKIVARMPMMIMQAGTPKFLQGYKDADKTAIGEKLLGLGTSLTNTETDLDNILNSSGKYYSLEVKPEEYFRTVDAPCRSAAAILGIADRNITIGGEEVPLSNVRWQEASNKSMFGYYKGAVAFYINSEAQVSESISNSTTQSQLAMKINEISALSREVQFLLGGVTNATGFDIANSMGQESLAKGNVFAPGLIGNMIGNLQTIISGGKMLFPEIWADSTFSKSYNVTIKLDSPDCDKFSIYMNILVPLFHILGLALPRSSGNNCYISPFLVRAYYKSMFHIDMGIITDCSIQKGELGAWTQDGLPTQIIVQLQIKDLYNILALATARGNNDLLSNPAQLDYIANLCGVNIAEPDIKRTLVLWSIIRGGNRIRDLIYNTSSSMMTFAYRKWNNLFTSHWTM